MLKMKRSILVALMMGALSVAGRADGEGTPGLPADPDSAALAEQPSGTTATAVLSAYRSSDQPYFGAPDAGGDWHRTAVEARGRAETDLRSARAQLAQASAEVARLVAEIRIEGAEKVDIGGEVRAARMAEAEWRRAVDTVLAHIGKIDAAIVMRGGDVAQASREVD
jgi:hypothetical protein